MTDQTIENPPVALEARAAALPGRTLTPRQARFAELYAATADATESYQAAYRCEGSSLATIRVNASRLLRHPGVAARIREAQEAAGALSLRSTQDLVADLEEAAYADVGELMAVWSGCCRHCHGVAGAYAWASPDEYARACDAAASKGEPLPTCEGGFSYDAGAEPAPDCTHCNGLGVARVRYHSTALASPAARRLVRGIETWPDGTLKRLHLADQSALRTELHKLRGLHWERHVNVNVNANAPAFENMTREQQHAFLEALRPTK